MHFETAGSLWGGRRVWVLARLPEYVELGADLSATYVYIANGHDGSMAVTAAVTPIRIACAKVCEPECPPVANGLWIQLEELCNLPHGQKRLRHTHNDAIEINRVELARTTPFPCGGR
jgi:hypothetical protein